MVSKRIKKIASLTYPCSFLADVGCDHGYLIIECFEKYNLKKAIAIDNKKMPLESAKKNISMKGFFDVRYSLSSGIIDVDKECDTVVIAGMGGILIKDIIEEGIKTNGKAHYEKMKFILQANRNLYDLRKYLNTNEFEIVNEEMVYDDNLYYEIIVCKVNDAISPLTYSELEFGPILLTKKDELFVEKYKKELEKLKKIANSSSTKVNEKIERIEKICL